MQDFGTIGEAPTGVIPIGDARFATHDIRLSSALCALGFSLRIDSQPVAVTLDADKGRRIVVFFHSEKSEHPNIENFTAREVELWWNSKPGKFSISGFDDALAAMKRVHAERAQLIDFAKHAPRYKPSRNMVVATTSLHTASILAACEIKLVGYDPSGRQWIFAKGAEAISDMIKTGGRPKERPLSNDLCIDWMLQALKYRDWLMQLVRDPENIPLIEYRDGEKILQISSGMNKADQITWINRL